VNPTDSFIFQWTIPTGVIQAGEKLKYLRWSSCGNPEILEGSNVTINGSVVTVVSGRTSTLVGFSASNDGVKISPTTTTEGSRTFTVSGASNGDSVGFVPAASTGTADCSGAVLQTVAAGQVSATLTQGTYQVCFKGQRVSDTTATSQKVIINAIVPSPSPSPSPSPEPSSSNGLDGGAIAGIVVGSVVGGLLLIAILGFVIFKAAGGGGGKADADVEEIVIHEEEQYQGQGYAAPTPATTPLYIPYY